MSPDPKLRFTQQALARPRRQVTTAMRQNLANLLRAARARANEHQIWWIYPGFTFTEVLKPSVIDRYDRKPLPSWMIVLTGCPKTVITTESTSTPNPSAGSASASVIGVQVNIASCPPQSTQANFQRTLDSYMRKRDRWRNRGIL